MKNLLASFMFILFLMGSSQAVTVDVQGLLEENPQRFKTLIKKAGELGVNLKWSHYNTSGWIMGDPEWTIVKPKTIKNEQQVENADYSIVSRSKGIKRDRVRTGMSNFTVWYYELIDKNGESILKSDDLKSRYMGTEDSQVMYYNQYTLGTKKTTALVKLLNKAIEHSEMSR